MTVKIKGENAHRDSNSGAVVMNDPEEWKRAKARKRQEKAEKDRDQRLNNLEKRMSRIEDLLRQIADKEG